MGLREVGYTNNHKSAACQQFPSPVPIPSSS